MFYKNCTKLDKANFIFSSSCTVYGQAEKMPITENASIQPADVSLWKYQTNW